MSEPAPIVTPTGDPARRARPPGVSVFGYRIGPETLAATAVALLALWGNSRYVTHEEFDAFKTGYWERNREQTKLLTEIQVGIGKINQSQADTAKSLDEIKADVRDLRKAPGHP